MKVFLSDLKRWIGSKGFWIAVFVQSGILLVMKPDSEFFRMSIPVCCTFPYATVWLSDYQSGYWKFCLIRTRKQTYITSKVASCAISAGAVTVLASCMYLFLEKGMEKELINILSFCLSSMIWAEVSSALSICSNSRSVAYGGGFICCYFLVILQERYLRNLYYLHPFEWIFPQQLSAWGNGWIVVFLFEILAILSLINGYLMWRRITCL